MKRKSFKQRIREAIFRKLGIADLVLADGTVICLDGIHCPEGFSSYVPTFATPVDVALANAQGALSTLSRSDHVHAVPVGTPVNVALANAEGTGTNFARRDHIHAVDVGAPSDIGTANAEGALTNFVRRDHVHNHPTGLGAELHHSHYARYEWDLFAKRFTQGTEVVSRVFMTPIQIRYTSTVDRIILLNDTTAAGNVRVGIYADNGDTPVGGALQVESASIAMAGTSVKQEFTIASTQLSPGLYWLAMNHDNATARWHREIVPYVDGGTLIVCYYALVFGAFTDPCPAVTNTTRVPAMGLRVASVP